jgi:hypothetical protein
MDAQSFNENITILTDSEEKVIEIIKSHHVMQDQFRQLTLHIEECYGRIERLRLLVESKILS